MQPPPGGDHRTSARPYFNKVAFYTLLCFALAGLIAGFAIGGFASRAFTGFPASTGSLTTRAPAIAGHHPSSAVTATPENVLLGEPTIATGDYVSQERADGATSYELSAQIINKTSNTPITATDVICRLWLTDDAQATATALSDHNYAIPRTISALNQLFPDEAEEALNFAPSSQQTQFCVANGKTSWTYTIADTVQHGTYYLAVLADWKGVHYNWYMIAITIVSQSQ